jgi:hypothetical protein
MGGPEPRGIGEHADVFGSLYIMSPCCLSPRPPGPPNPELAKALEAVKTPADSAKLSFFARATLASAAAWSPNPKNPPLYLDLTMKDGIAQPEVLARWTANAPLAFVDQYTGDLRRYRGSRSMLATRTDYESIPPSCMRCSIGMESLTASNCTRGLTPAGWLIVSRIMCCLSSAGPFVSRLEAARKASVCIGNT